MGPLTLRQRSTAAKQYKAYFLIFVCAVTGMCNVQLIEGKDTSSILDGCSRFFCETTVPRVMLPDDDGALLRVFSKWRFVHHRGIQHMVRWKGKFVPCKSHYHSSRLKIRDTQLRDG